VFIFGVLEFDRFMLVVLVGAMSGMVFGVCLRYVRGEFRPVGSTSGFHFLDFFFGEFRNFDDGRFLGFLGALIGVFFRIFFVEVGSADNGIGFRFFRSFFVLGFHETGGQRGDLIFV
jgi:hypothetical protein